MAVCQKKSWSVNDRVALVSYLANPGFEIGYNGPNKSKMLAWKFFFDENYYSMGEPALQKKEASFFHLVYRYVLQKKNLHLYDSLSICNFTLDNKKEQRYTSKIEGNPDLDQPVLNRLGQVKSILVFPCVTELFGTGKNQMVIFKFKKDKCPKTREEISPDEYSMYLSWLVKDYVLKGVKDYKSMIVYFLDSNGEPDDHARYFDFNDPMFTDMYEHQLFNAIKNDGSH